MHALCTSCWCYEKGMDWEFRRLACLSCRRDWAPFLGFQTVLLESWAKMGKSWILGSGPLLGSNQTISPDTATLQMWLLSSIWTKDLLCGLWVVGWGGGCWCGKVRGEKRLWKTWLNSSSQTGGRWALARLYWFQTVLQKVKIWSQRLKSIFTFKSLNNKTPCVSGFFYLSKRNCLHGKIDSTDQLSNILHFLKHLVFYVIVLKL